MVKDLNLQHLIKSKYPVNREVNIRFTTEEKRRTMKSALKQGKRKRFSLETLISGRRLRIEWSSERYRLLFG